MGRGDDGFFSVFDDVSDYLSGKKKGGFGKYDKVIDRTLEEIPDAPQKSTSMPVKRSTSYGKKRSRDRAMMPRVSRKKKKRKYVQKTRTFKKGRKPKKPTMTVKKTYDQHGNVSRDRTLWFGLHHHGSREGLYDAAAESITRAILAKAKVYPTHYDQSMDGLLITGAKLSIIFRTHKEDTGEAYDTARIVASSNLNTKSFHSIVGDVKNTIVDYADGNFTGATSNAYYPIYISLDYSSNEVFHRIDNLDEAMLYINCYSTCKIQNLCYNGDGTNDTDVNNTNPIQGKRYDFYRSRASLVNDLVVAGSAAGTAANYMPLEDTDVPDGITSLPQLPTGDPLDHPPQARTTFQRCKGVANVYVRPGGTKAEKTTYSIKMSVRRFIANIAPRNSSFWGITNGLGRVSWFCFERAMKQNGTGATVDTVKIGFNRELTVTSVCIPKSKRVMQRHYADRDLGAI